MADDQQLEATFDRIAAGRATDADVAWLRDAVQVRGRGHTVQVGKYNVHGVGGVLQTIGVLVVLVGMGFFYGLITAMTSDPFADPDRFGPPTGSVMGFTIAATGTGLVAVGALVSAWTNRDRRPYRRRPR